VCSFGRDEKLLQSWIDLGESKPIIVLKCDKLIGYKIENISMMKRLSNTNEGEVLVEGPAFFKVKSEPLKLKNYVIVDIEYMAEESKDKTYLPFPEINRE